MTQALLAAEADKIQDFIFRASHLREVTGGSALLTRFCKEIPGLLPHKPVDRIIHDGGNFRLAFADKSEAKAAGDALADYYYQMTGCSLTVAPPVDWDGSDLTFQQANQQAGSLLRSAKREKAPVASAHLPYIAFCASTGVELAADYRQVKPRQRPTYASRASLHKKYEREDSRREEFLEQFLTLIHQGQQHDLDFPTEADQVGSYDSRNYVAYLVADGNGMGAVFDKCQCPNQVATLSIRLTEIVRDSLAIPARSFLNIIKKSVMPVLPMILGGDDLFVLLPAPYALAFAEQFCREFEQRMAACLQDELKLDPAQIGHPTMAAAIVICKASYPFQLAHQRGEALLKAAKRFAKSLPGRPSTVNVELIVGSTLEETNNNQHQPTLAPYLVGDVQVETDQPSTTISTLLAVRELLTDLEQKPRAQLLNEVFDQPQLQRLDKEPKRIEWQERLEAKIQHIGALREAEWAQESEQRSALLQQLHYAPDKLEAKFRSYRDLGKVLIHLLTILGGKPDLAYWRNIPRNDETRFGNALPHIFELWDYLKRLPEPDSAKEKRA
ncbi:MAG: hypothetical protein KJZ93_03710 [Caldilineaceae bacterium]|nr:hypothetical protein [Caldilineaceae bacterium]